MNIQGYPSFTNLLGKEYRSRTEIIVLQQKVFESWHYGKGRGAGEYSTFIGECIIALHEAVRDNKGTA